MKGGDEPSHWKLINCPNYVDYLHVIVYLTLGSKDLPTAIPELNLRKVSKITNEELYNLYTYNNNIIANLRGVKLTTHLQLLPRSRTCGTIINSLSFQV
jgi:hypothetical protein